MIGAGRLTSQQLLICTKGKIYPGVVVESVDAADSKSVVRKGVWVRVPPSPYNLYRNIAQPGSALALGARGRRFESFYSDQIGYN